jgi:hypothetical protein
MMNPGPRPVCNKGRGFCLLDPDRILRWLGQGARYALLRLSIIKC